MGTCLHVLLHKVYARHLVAVKFSKKSLERMSEPKFLTWQVPVDTEPWVKDFDTIYTELLGSQIRYVEGKKYTTRIIEAGMKNDEPLILIHGSGGSAEAYFRNVMRLGQDFHVCAMDALFHGFSSKEAAPDAPLDRTGAQVDHLLDFMDAMGWQQANIVGESMGAHITFRLAHDHPERVKRIVLNTGHQVKFKRDDFLPFQKGGDSLRVLSQLAVTNPNPRSIRLRMEWLMTTPDRVTDELVALRLKYYQMQKDNIVPGSVAGMTQQRMFEEDDCKNIKAETLCFWTEYNPSTGVDQGEYLASLIPSSKFYLMKDAAHWPQYEHPEEHDAVITKFIKTGQV